MTHKERLFKAEAVPQMECEGLKNIIPNDEEKVEHLYEIIRELKQHRFGPRRKRKSRPAYSMK